MKTAVSLDTTKCCAEQTNKEQFCVFYLTRSSVYHLVARIGCYPDVTLCGWRYHNCQVKNPYYDAKLGRMPRDAQGRVRIYGKRLCKNCKRVLDKIDAQRQPEEGLPPDSALGRAHPRPGRPAKNRIERQPGGTSW